MPLLPRRRFGLALAGDLPIGGPGDRGEIVEVGPQCLAPTSDRRRVPPLGKSLRPAGGGVEGGPAQQLQRVVDRLCAHPFGNRRTRRLVQELALVFLAAEPILNVLSIEPSGFRHTI